MPDEALAEGLILTAKKLMLDEENISQADLRRAVSTAYYAVYHALAKVAADSLVGADRENRPNNAWVEVYRGLSHGATKDSCAKSKMVGFPLEIEGFADIFVQLQDARKRVDYDPRCRTTIEAAKLWIGIAEVGIANLYSAKNNDKVAFAAWVLISSPGASHARIAVKSKVGPELGTPA